MNHFKPHTLKQERAIFTEKPVLLLGTGTQFGKTTVGALRMKRFIHKFTNKDDAFIITSPTYKTMMQSTLPPFLKIMKGYGTHNKKDDVFEVFNGGKVYLRTETDPDSIVGITNVKHIWGDEAGKYRLYFWENIQARADFCGCGVDLTTSPYALNWVYKDLIKPVNSGKRSDVEYIWAASWENPYHSLYDPLKREHKRSTMDPRRFDMLYGGEFGKMVGRVYDCFDDEANICDPFALPTGTRFVAGVDWGFSPDPFACVIRAITPDGRHYQVHEFCKTGMTIQKIIEALTPLQKIYKIEMFYCDPSRPDNIQAFNEGKLPAVKAENGIRIGIDRHYELMAARKYKIFKGTSPHTIDETETYHYPELVDLGPDDDSSDDLPVDQNNHCLDANRYCTISTYRSNVRHIPKVPNEMKPKESTDQFFERLKKKRRVFEDY